MKGLDFSPLLQKAERKLASVQTKASFRQFIDKFSYEPKPAAHHELLISKLQDVADGKCKRLMVFMPPGGAKSFYANVMFSAWFIGRNPGKKLITASYSQEVADKWGRRVRSIVRDEQYAELMSAGLSKDSQAAGRWALSTDAEYYAVGVGGSVTSFRADLGVIDDPVKGREEAESETIRSKIIEWYKSDFWTRLKPGAAVVLIMTRWHEEDIAGWLLEEAKSGGEQWEVLSLPMEAEANDPLGRNPGEILWPEWFTPEMVAIAKRDARTWTSLYQQRPTPEDGDFFKREWLQFYDELPQNLKKYGASDYATKDGSGDYTVHIVGGVDVLDDLYIIDLWREQKDPMVWVDALISLIVQHKPLQWGEGKDIIAGSLGSFIDKRQRETQAYCYREQFTMPARSGDISGKQMAAQAIRGRFAQRKVWLPRNAPWLADFIHELMMFPNGKYDDQVDTIALFGRMLGDMAKAQEAKAPTEPEFRLPTFNEMVERNKRRMNGDD